MEKTALYARDLNVLRWTKSSKSHDDDPPDNCVEFAAFSDGVALRDSKNLSRLPLLFTHSEWAAFTAGVRAGEFDI